MSEETKEVEVSDADFRKIVEGFGMEAVEATTAISKKIVRLMDEVGSVPKDKSNDFHHYRYLSAEGILGKVQPALVKLGLVARQTMRLVSQEWVDLKNKQHYCLVQCHLTIEDAETGEFMTVVSLGSGMDTNDKAVMKAQTAAHKYAWYHLLNISTQDDPEADTATDSLTAAPVSQPRATESVSSEVFGMTTKVLAVGKKTANERSPYLITTEHGDFTTFNKDVAVSAELAKGLGSEITFEYVNREYKGVVEKKIVDPPKKGTSTN